LMFELWIWTDTGRTPLFFTRLAN